MDKKTLIKGLENAPKSQIEAMRLGQLKYNNFIKDLTDYLEREDANTIKANQIELPETLADTIIYADIIEDSAKEQVLTLANQPFSKKSRIRVMPDVHAGAGSVIGLTMTSPPIIPNLVGVDIGCGVMSVEIGEIGELNEEDLKEIDEKIHKTIPKSFNVYDKKIHGFEKKLKKLHCYDSLKNTDRIERSLGTLGGGNHFLELGVSNITGSYYLTVHTGSRGLGHQVATHYQNLALKKGLKEVLETKNSDIKALIKELKERGEEHLIEGAIENLNEYYAPYGNLPKDLSLLPYKDSTALHYLEDMAICLEFAHLNRRLVLDRVLKAVFGKRLKDLYPIENVHNYIDFKDGILRKGAISAKEGELLLIPINMRDGIILAVGKGNHNWNYSAPHGAGRLMSRRQAQDTIEHEDLQRELKDNNVYTTTGDLAIDEAPQAYKDMDSIVNNIDETATIIAVIEPVYSYKG